MDSTTARTFARLLASGRVAIGVVAMATPTVMARPWIGDPADSPTSKLLARTMGGRDLALGLGALRSLGLADQEARPWLALGGMADTVDALATLMAFGSLPRRTRWGILATTVGAAAASLGVVRSLDSPPAARPTEAE
jgi:hypothetical protein